MERFQVGFETGFCAVPTQFSTCSLSSHREKWNGNKHPEPNINSSNEALSYSNVNGRKDKWNYTRNMKQYKREILQRYVFECNSKEMRSGIFNEIVGGWWAGECCVSGICIKATILCARYGKHSLSIRPHTFLFSIQHICSLAESDKNQTNKQNPLGASEFFTPMVTTTQISISRQELAMSISSEQCSRVLWNFRSNDKMKKKNHGHLVSYDWNWVNTVESTRQIGDRPFVGLTVSLASKQLHSILWLGYALPRKKNSSSRAVDYKLHSFI